MASKVGCHKLRAMAGTIFTPGTPVNERDLFAGRLEQLDKISDAVSQVGYHAVLYGERGVGKTSLANVVSSMSSPLRKLTISKVTCDAGDNYASLWHKAFQDLTVIGVQPGFGFGSQDHIGEVSLDSQIGNNASPNDIRRLLLSLSKASDLLIIFDEFDRVSDSQTTSLMADTIKTLSDGGVSASILIVGVADSVDSLIDNHASVERALVQVPLPRMSASEIKQIVENGVLRLGMTIKQPALKELVALSQGLPYITHLLGLHVSRAAISDERLDIEAKDVDTGISLALDQWQQSIKTSYYEATLSPQPGNIFKEVLLACALAPTDDLGYFSAASVRSSLQDVTGKPYDIPNFARHLKLFSEESRGRVLERIGQTRRLRYRFVSPIMKPFIIMRGFSDGLLKREAIPK